MFLSIVLLLSIRFQLATGANQQCTDAPYLTHVLHGPTHQTTELSDILLTNAEQALRKNNFNAAHFLCQHALRLEPTLTTKTNHIFTAIHHAVKSATQTKHRSLYQAIDDAKTLTNLGYNGSSIDIDKALARATKLWDKALIKRMMRTTIDKPENLKWFKYTTTLFRMLFNEWSLAKAMQVGREAVNVGFRLLPSTHQMPYIPVEYNALYFDNVPQDVLVTAGLFDMVTLASGYPTKTLHRLLNPAASNSETLLMDKSAYRNNFGQYVTQLLSSPEPSPELPPPILPPPPPLFHRPHLHRCRQKIQHHQWNRVLQKVDARTMTKDEFVKQYLDQGRPAVLSHYLEAISVPNQTSWHMWDVQRLVGRFSNSLVATTTSSSVSARQYLHDNVPMALSTTETFQSFYDTIHQDKQYMHCDPPYLFATLHDADVRKELNIDLLTEHWFDEERFHMNVQERNERSLFYIGGELSGAYFHHHGAAVNVLFKGKKKWYLLPPKMFYGPTSMNLVTWMHGIKPFLKYPPLEVLQEEGDLVFVPTAWSHATMNLEETLGVAIEVGMDLKLSTV